MFDERLIAALRGFAIIGPILLAAALFDVYRKRKSPGPHQPKKLNRRDIFAPKQVVG
jgi:hypothetical protein